MSTITRYYQGLNNTSLLIINNHGLNNALTMHYAINKIVK